MTQVGREVTRVVTRAGALGDTATSPRIEELRRASAARTPDHRHTTWDQLRGRQVPPAVGPSSSLSELEVCHHRATGDHFARVCVGAVSGGCGRPSGAGSMCVWCVSVGGRMSGCLRWRVSDRV